jgi:hypothetical protein
LTELERLIKLQWIADTLLGASLKRLRRASSQAECAA